METSILKQFRRMAGEFIEPKFLKSGTVLEVRRWDDEPIIELDLHLPIAQMEQWNEVPYIKFRVDDLCFRDYTPFGWDAETATCSLLINVAHDGPGSLWAEQLRAGEKINYLKIDCTRHALHPTNLVVGLGDASSLAHLLAMHQLILPRTRFDGAVILESPKTAQLFKDYFRSPLNIVKNHEELAEWLIKQNYCASHTCFYIAGNHPMVCRLDRLMKILGYTHIRAIRVWS